MKIGIMGAGVVGGTLAKIAADEGHSVALYDPPKELNDLTALEDSRMIFICVWTPNEGGKLDTSAVFDAAEKAFMLNVPLIVVRSTIPLGVMTQLEARFPQQHFAFVPEFLVERDPLASTRVADRVIIGSSRGEYEAREALLDLEDLLRVVSPGSPIVRLDTEEAVMVKLASNALLAAKVALAVELSDIAKAYGVDWEKVRGAVSLDRRIGPSHLAVTAERGYGGNCFPKDVQGVIAAAFDQAVDSTIISTIQETNERRFRVPSVDECDDPYCRPTLSEFNTYEHKTMRDGEVVPCEAVHVGA